MGRRGYVETEQDKLDRIQRLTEAIAEIESYLQFFDDKGKQAEDGCWVVRYQVRQKEKIYWYYNPDSALQKVALNTTSLGLIIKYNCLSS